MGKKNKEDSALEAIAEKMSGKHLSESEINDFVYAVANNLIGKTEIANFLVAVQKRGMSFQEIYWLTRAMVSTGDTLHWNSKIVADKHCIGGVAGNRTTPIVVSICAAAGILIPKTSSRSITSAAGTADTMETLARVKLSASEVKRVVNKAGACIVWGGAFSLAPLDDMMIRIERALDINPVPQLLASIFSKKIAAGSTHILIDIPYGLGAKVTHSQALKLKKDFILAGKKFGKKMRVVLTDGSQPIGRGIGPVLEMYDVLSVLDRKDYPEDLEKKSVFLAAELLELTGKAKPGQGKKLAMEILESGKAMKAFTKIVEAQGKTNLLIKAPHTLDIISKKSGRVRKIGNREINSLAKTLGCPYEKGSGIYIHKHVGEKVLKGEKIMTLYAESKQKLGFAKSIANKNIFNIS